MITLFTGYDEEPKDKKKDQEAQTAEEESPQGGGFFSRMRQAVSRTRETFSTRINDIVALTREVDESCPRRARNRAHHERHRRPDHQRNHPGSPRARPQAGHRGRRRTARPAQSPTARNPRSTDTPRRRLPSAPPEVTFLVGVNGTGKTTTSGKLAAWYRAQNKSVLLCAADTFRAAAIEQLEVWAGRSGVEMIKTRQGGDPAAVLYDAASAAKARNIAELIVDTAGRLHTKSGLMDELDKMRRTASKLIPGAPHEVLLVMDATTGQNGLQQARQFTQSAGATGIVLTKLDGTAKGGIAVAIARELNLPVRFVGVGEKMSDLLEFSPEAFVDALLG